MTKDPETAEDFIRLALKAESKSDLRRALLISALLIEGPDFLANITGGPPRKRGRPQVTVKDLEIGETDRKALFMMWQRYFDTGETKARTLARAAVDSGEIDLGYSDYNSVVDRLAKAWREAAKDGLPTREQLKIVKDQLDVFIEDMEPHVHRGDGRELIRLTRAAFEFLRNL